MTNLRDDGPIATNMAHEVIADVQVSNEGDKIWVYIESTDRKPISQQDLLDAFTTLFDIRAKAYQASKQADGYH